MTATDPLGGARPITAAATIDLDVPRFTHGAPAVPIRFGLVTGWLRPVTVAFASLAVPRLGGPAALHPRPAGH